MVMNKVISTFISFLALSATAFAQSNTTESLTITTYYPAPYGVYRNLKLNPSDEPTAASGLDRGVMYYDNSTNTLRYHNDTVWVNLTGGGGTAGGWEYNTTSGHVYNVNTGNIGIGTKTPSRKLTIVGTATDPVKLQLRGPHPDFELVDTQVPSGVQISSDGNLFEILKDNAGDSDFSSTSYLMSIHIPDGKVGIGTGTPQVPLHIETPLLSGFVIKNGKNNADVTLRSGAVSIMPWRDSVYIAANCYYRDGTWVQDPGVNPTKNGKIIIDAVDGGSWSASTNVPVKGFWDINDVPLWDGSGAVYIGSSSRSAKENFIRLDPDEILQKIDQLDVSRWNYKSQDKSVTHIGPVAEDFYRIFKTGNKEKSIAVIDSTGVSLAGVKALSKKVNMQQRQIEKLQVEIEDLKSRLKNY
jgi:hypothetical protein